MYRTLSNTPYKLNESLTFIGGPTLTLRPRLDIYNACRDKLNRKTYTLDRNVFHSCSGYNTLFPSFCWLKR